MADATGAGNVRTATHSGQEVTFEVCDREVLVSTTVKDVRITVARRNLEAFDVECDPCFFDEGYTIAGSTGFLVWESNYFLIRLLHGELGQRLAGRRVLDLGSGPGLAGLAVAAVGANVLLTDLPSVVEGNGGIGVRDNIQRNATPGGPLDMTAWEGAVRVGQGSAAAMPLDWTRPLPTAPCNPLTADYILAADCIWLKDIFDCFVDTVLAVLRAGICRACIMAFTERANEDSKLFVRAEAVPRAFLAKGCTVKVLHAEDVVIEGEGAKPGQVLEIRLAGPVFGFDGVTVYPAETARPRDADATV